MGGWVQSETPSIGGEGEGEGLTVLHWKGSNLCKKNKALCVILFVYLFENSFATSLLPIQN